LSLPGGSLEVLLRFVCFNTLIPATDRARKGAPLKVRIRKATKARLAAIARHCEEAKCKYPRPALVATLSGAEWETPLPAGTRKVPASVRAAVAASTGATKVILPFELAKDAPGRSTPESMRLYVAKYLLPVWPELEAAWQSLILVADEAGLPVLYAVED
jgi:hypothetical protein